MCVPVMTSHHEISQIKYLAIPLSYKVWKHDGPSKLELAANLVDEVMQVNGITQRQVILYVDSWYMKKPFSTVCKNIHALD